MVGTRVYILARRRMNIERGINTVFTTVFSVSKILRVASVSLSRATDQTRANPSESE